MDMIYRIALNAVRSPADAVIVQEGVWNFTFEVPLTAVEAPLTVPDLEADLMLPGGEYTKTTIEDVRISSVGITYCYRSHEDAHTESPMPILLL